MNDIHDWPTLLPWSGTGLGGRILPSTHVHGCYCIPAAADERRLSMSLRHREEMSTVRWVGDGRALLSTVILAFFFFLMLARSKCGVLQNSSTFFWLMSKNEANFFRQVSNTKRIFFVVTDETPLANMTKHSCRCSLQHYFIGLADCARTGVRPTSISNAIAETTHTDVGYIARPMTRSLSDHQDSCFGPFRSGRFLEYPFCDPVCLPSTQLFFFYFHVLCLIWHVIERNG